MGQDLPCRNMVALECVEALEDVDELKHLIELHRNYTSSTVAADLLRNWDKMLPQFVKVMPTDYKRVLEQRKKKVTLETNQTTPEALATGAKT